MEIWKLLSIGPFKTETSSLGRVTTGRGPTFGTKVRQGYRVVTLFADDGSKRRFYVHRLIALAFIENGRQLPQINHLDGNKSNNCVENLEWCDHSRNQLHAIEIGLRRANPWTDKNTLKRSRGETHGNSKLSEKQVLEIRALRELGLTFRAIANKFGTGETNVWMICTRKRWAHI